MMEQGIMPFLKEFVGSGVRANLLSVIPPITPPAWTSLVTGRSPGYHGVFDFFQKEEKSHHIRFTTSQDVQCETVWSLASRQGARVTSLNFPLMMPPPAINGNVVSGGWITWRQLRLGCYPDDLYDRLKALPGFNARELAMDMAHEGRALEGCKNEEYEEWVNLHIRREHQWFNILKYLMREDPCDLTAILFDGIDKIQHLCWRFLSPDYHNGSPSPWERRIRDLCLEYFSRLDQLLSEVVDMAGPDSTIIMASDHGFGAQREIFFLNAWLEQNGYLAWAKGNYREESQSGILGMGQLAKHVYMLDWDRTLAYASTPSSNGIHIVIAGQDHGKGVAKADYEQFRRELIEKAYGVTSQRTDEPLVSRIWTREEAFGGPYMSQAPDLTLMLRDGGLISILPSDESIKQRKEPYGAHRMEGVVIVKGPGIRRGESLDAVSILDVAPVLLYTLGLDIPENMEGHVPSGMFDSSYLKRHPIRVSGLSDSVAPAEQRDSDQVIFDAEAEAKLAGVLRALGYIE